MTFFLFYIRIHTHTLSLSLNLCLELICASSGAPVLIVCPSALINHWSKEIENLALFRTAVYHTTSLSQVFK